MIRLGYAQELDQATHAERRQHPARPGDVDFDPGRTHSLTWQSGLRRAGVGQGEGARRAAQRSSDLWEPELAGRVEVLSEMRDTIGLIMLDQGVDPSGDWSDDDFYDALERAASEKIDSGHIRQVRGNSYTQDLASGDAIAVIGWSGDITSLNYEADDRFEFAIPEAGGTLWSDNLMVPDRLAAPEATPRAHELLLRPRGRRRGGRVGQLHHARCRAPRRRWRPSTPSSPRTR